MRWETELRGRISLLVGFLLFLLVGCGNDAPEIRRFTWDLTLVESDGSEEDPGYSQEELSFFVLAEDKDGPDEVEYIYLIQEEEELSWILDEENWENISMGNDVWLGTSSLRMPGGEEFPRKNYRLVVIDKTGQRSEKEFYPAVKGGEEPIFPKGKVEGKFFVLESPYSTHTLRVYNRTGEIVSETQSGDYQIPLDLLKKGTSPGEELRIVIFTKIENRGIILRTTPRPF